MSDVKAKMHSIRFPLQEVPPQTQLKELTVFNDFFRGHHSTYGVTASSFELLVHSLIVNMPTSTARDNTFRLTSWPQRRSSERYDNAPRLDSWTVNQVIGAR